MFFKHVCLDVFEEHDLLALQNQQSDYNALLRNFGFDPSGRRSSNIKEKLQKEFDEKIGFHDHHRNNESTLVYDILAGDSYTEGTLYSLGISKYHSLYNATKCINVAPW